MANSEKHQWARWALALATVVFTWGMTYQQITAQGAAIVKLDGKDEVQDEKIHILQMSAQNLQHIATDTLKTLASIETSLETLKGISQQQETSIALIQRDLTSWEAADE